MQKISEYRAHAQECRLLAEQMTNSEQRRQLEDIARTWEILAQKRTQQLTKPSQPQS